MFLKNIYVSVLMIIVLNAKAQINIISCMDIHSKASASELFPSRLGVSGVNNEINLIDIYAGISNNALSISNIQSIRKSLNTDSTLNVNDLASKLKKQTNIYTKTDLPLWNALFTIAHKKKYPIILQAGMRYRIEANAAISKNMTSFIADGNQQWAGQNVNLGNIQLNALFLLQDYLGVSVPIPIKIGKTKTLTIVPAVKYNYFKSIANINTANSDIFMYTEPNGQYVRFNYAYKIQTALPSILQSALYKALGYTHNASADSSNPNSILGSRGKGYGFDLGIGAHYGDRWSFDFSLVDLGSITFKNDVNTFSKSGTYMYTGWTTQYDYFGHYTHTIIPNKVQLQPDTLHNAYSTVIGGKMSFMLNYHTQKVLDDDDKVAFYRQNIYLIYMQGLADIYATTRTTLVAVGYAYSLKKVLSVGANLSAGGYYPSAAGLFVSLKLGTFTWTLGSNNVGVLLMPNSAYGVDLYSRMGFIF